MFHTVAFSQAGVTAAFTGLVTPVADPTVFINGNNLLVPDKINQLWAAAPFATAGVGSTKTQLQSPSLREVFFPTVNPFQVSANLDNNVHIFELFDDPIPLVTNEGLNLLITDAAGASALMTGSVVWLADGPRTPVAKSKIFTMRATSSVTLTANTWQNGPLTFDQTLPVGNYDIVGMRAQGTGLLAARLVFIGATAAVRPGCPGSANNTNEDVIEFRMGRLGTWGTFYSLTPPSIDCLGVTGTSQILHLDLVQR